MGVPIFTYSGYGCCYAAKGHNAQLHFLPNARSGVWTLLDEFVGNSWSVTGRRTRTKAPVKPEGEINAWPRVPVPQSGCVFALRS